eukprot:m.21035 g.21035  ORF g.21035 m.21035 type:complete len:104 (+) comp28129_c0_seq2:635-946(+)
MIVTGWRVVNGSLSHLAHFVAVELPRSGENRRAMTRFQDVSMRLAIPCVTEIKARVAQFPPLKKQPVVTLSKVDQKEVSPVGCSGSCSIRDLLLLETNIKKCL